MVTRQLIEKLQMAFTVDGEMIDGHRIVDREMVDGHQTEIQIGTYIQCIVISMLS